MFPTLMLLYSRHSPTYETPDNCHANFPVYIRHGPTIYFRMLVILTQILRNRNASQSVKLEIFNAAWQSEMSTAHKQPQALKLFRLVATRFEY